MRRLIPSVPMLAVLLSVLLHGAVLLPAIGLLDEPPTDRADPMQLGTVELLPVEVAGTDASPATAEPTQPAEPVAAAQPETTRDSAEARPAPHAAADPSPPVAAAPPPPAPPSPTTSARAPASPASQESDRLMLSLSGTDSASNATVSGPNLIPASPDDQSRNRPPVYPQDAARRGQQGTVVVLIRVSSLGLAEGAEVLTSSGHRALDQAAVDAVMTWRFRPAVQDGRAIPFEMPMRIVFAMR